MSDRPFRLQAFLLCLSHTGNVTVAAEWAGCSRSHLYHWRAQDAEFAADWDDALQAAFDRLEHFAWQQAISGIEVPYFYKGEQVAVIRRFSERLMIQLLNRRPPPRDEMSPGEGKDIEAELKQKLARLFEADGQSPAANLSGKPDKG